MDGVSGKKNLSNDISFGERKLYLLVLSLWGNKLLFCDNFITDGWCF
jgi:hypothetical protein